MLALLLALATLVAVQALGSLLVVAMLVGPAATARGVCHRVPAMMGVSIAVAAAAAVAGMYASYHARTGASASVTAAVAVIYALVVGAEAAHAAVRARRGSATPAAGGDMSAAARPARRRPGPGPSTPSASSRPAVTVRAAPGRR